MPGTARPDVFGRSRRSRAIRSAGTWPSRTYPSTSAVWQAARSLGTACLALIGRRSLRFSVVTGNPYRCRWPTHWVQHPQVGLLYTVISESGSAPARKSRPAASVIPSATPPSSSVIRDLSTFIMSSGRKRCPLTLVDRARRPDHVRLTIQGNRTRVARLAPPTLPCGTRARVVAWLMALGLHCRPVLVSAIALVVLCATSGEHTAPVTPGGCGLQAPEFWKPDGHAAGIVHARAAIGIPDPTAACWIGHLEIAGASCPAPPRFALSPRAPPIVTPLSA